MTQLKFVGKSPSRIDGLEKVTGAANYVDDLEFGPNLLHAEIVESPLRPRADQEHRYVRG